MGASIYALGAGLVWYCHALTRTGHRKRDLPLLFVPIYGAFFVPKVLWRYTARDVYWDERDDRPSDVLGGWPRPAAIAAGWLVGPALFALGIGAAMMGEGWSDQDRAEFRQLLRDEGIEGTARRACMMDVVESRVDYPDSASQSEWDDAVESAVLLC